MQKGLLYIIWVTMLMGFVSIFYFIWLKLAVLPFIIVPLIAVVFAYISYVWLQNIAYHTSPVLSRKQAFLSYFVFATGVTIITAKAYYAAPQYGNWDAWTIWNNHAKFLMVPGQYGLLFKSPHYCVHPDYPLFISATVAFVWHLLGSQTQLVPLLLSFFFTLALPVALFFALYRRSILVASIALLLLAGSDFYIERAIAQYADVPLAFMFLCALISLSTMQKDKKQVALTGVLLGCCMWTKNEGIMLSFFFMLFNGRQLIKNGNYKYFFAGIIIPLSILVLFKAGAPATDLIDRQSSSTFYQITDWSRYKMIANSIIEQLDRNFIGIKYGFFIYLVLCLLYRKLPDRFFLMLLACIGGYFFVYLLTPNNLEWHLATSIDRIIMQIYPALLYVMAVKISSIGFIASTKISS